MFKTTSQSRLPEPHTDHGIDGFCQTQLHRSRITTQVAVRVGMSQLLAIAVSSPLRTAFVTSRFDSVLPGGWLPHPPKNESTKHLVLATAVIPGAKTVCYVQHLALVRYELSQDCHHIQDSLSTPYPQPFGILSAAGDSTCYRDSLA